MKNATLSGSMPKRNVIGRFVENNRKAIVEVIAALFILLFLYTGISKSIVIDKTVNVINITPVLKQFAFETAWAIVILEYIAAALLFIPTTKKAGLYLSLSLMMGFTGYIIYMMSFVPDLPCSCGGVVSNLTWHNHLYFNLSFIILSIIGLVIYPRKSK
jgi:hypothetical protein